MDKNSTIKNRRKYRKKKQTHTYFKGETANNLQNKKQIKNQL